MKFSKKYLFKIYFIFIHILLIILFIKGNIIERVKIRLNMYPPEFAQQYHSMVNYHSRIDKNLSAKSILFIGDSHIQSLAVSMVTPFAINYGIGGDTTQGVINRLPKYQSLDIVKTVILEIGQNDLKDKQPEEVIKNYRMILDYIPSRVKIIVCSLFPVDENIIGYKVKNAQIIKLNQKIKKLTQEYPNVIFADAFHLLSDNGNLLQRYHIGDGVHLNKEGYAIWIYFLQDILNERI